MNEIFPYPFEFTTGSQLLNKKPSPIKNQDDREEILEMTERIEEGEEPGK